MIYVTISVLCGVILYQWIDKTITVKRLERVHQEANEQWIAERKDLLDRIQAPSFAEYASKVIREKAAEQPKEEEPEIEFVS